MFNDASVGPGQSLPCLRVTYFSVACDTIDHSLLLKTLPSPGFQTIKITLRLSFLVIFRVSFAASPPPQMLKNPCAQTLGPHVYSIHSRSM